MDAQDQKYVNEGSLNRPHIQILFVEKYPIKYEFTPAQHHQVNTVYHLKLYQDRHCLPQ